MFKFEALRNRIRGWLPKEPSFANPLVSQVSQHPKRRVYIAYSIVFFSVFAAVFITMSIGQGLGLDSTNLSFGAATAGVIAAILVGIMLRKPTQNKPLTKTGKRTAKKIAAVNAGYVGVFLGTYFLVNPCIRRVEVTLGLWIVLLFSMFLVNNLLYRNFKKQLGIMEEM
ncbi:MAG: hypothetical protein ACFCUE_07170 [Candidatus Bathyarchaeia archaeon]